MPQEKPMRRPRTKQAFEARHLACYTAPKKMRITFDPAKDARNQEKHGLAFAKVASLDWTQALIETDTRAEYGEPRYVAYAPKGRRLHIVCFTVRDGGMRIISFRKGNARENKHYAQRATY